MLRKIHCLNESFVSALKPKLHLRQYPSIKLKFSHLGQKKMPKQMRDHGSSPINILKQYYLNYICNELTIMLIIECIILTTLKTREN